VVSFQSDEDLELKRRLEEYVESVQHSDPGVQKLALEMMRYPFLFLDEF